MLEGRRLLAPRPAWALALPRRQAANDVSLGRKHCHIVGVVPKARSSWETPCHSHLAKASVVRGNHST